MSIIIVYYNTGNKNGYLEQVIKSLERQTVQDYNVIIINNNSPIPIDYDVSKNKKIKVMDLEVNFGQCFARNVGINLAEGERITWNDGDWLYCKDYIEKHLSSTCDVFNCNQFNVDYNYAWQFLLENEGKIHAPSGLVQDASDISSFLNTTRGCSIRLDVLQRHKFNTALSYIEGDKMQLGRGWEDVELGIRLKKLGFTTFGGDTNTFVVHMSHKPTGINSEDQNFYDNALINFIKLIYMHGDIFKLCPEWALQKLKCMLNNCNIKQISQLLKY